MQLLPAVFLRPLLFFATCLGGWLVYDAIGVWAGDDVLADFAGSFLNPRVGAILALTIVLALLNCKIALWGRRVFLDWGLFIFASIGFWQRPVGMVFMALLMALVFHYILRRMGAARDQNITEDHSFDAGKDRGLPLFLPLCIFFLTTNLCLAGWLAESAFDSGVMFGLHIWALPILFPLFVEYRRQFSQNNPLPHWLAQALRIMMALAPINLTLIFLPPYIVCFVFVFFAVPVAFVFTRCRFLHIPVIMLVTGGLTAIFYSMVLQLFN